MECQLPQISKGTGKKPLQSAFSQMGLVEALTFTFQYFKHQQHCLAYKTAQRTSTYTRERQSSVSDNLHSRKNYLFFFFSSLIVWLYISDKINKALGGFRKELQSLNSIFPHAQAFQQAGMCTVH